MTIVKQTFLANTVGSSDKVYHIQLLQVSSGGDEDNEHFRVVFQFGRRGKNLTYGTKTHKSVSLFQANQIFNKLMSSKLNRGYRHIMLNAQDRSMLEFMIALSY